MNSSLKASQKARKQLKSKLINMNKFNAILKVDKIMITENKNETVKLLNAIISFHALSRPVFIARN